MYQTNYLAHYGIKGQKWGVRRFQNPDGTLTAAGKKREAKQYSKELNKTYKALNEKVATNLRNDMNYRKNQKKYRKYVNEFNNMSEGSEKALKRKMNKATKHLNKANKAMEKRDKTTREIYDLDDKWVGKRLEAEKKGYTLTDRDYVQSTKLGEQIVTQMLTGHLGMAVLQAQQIHTYGNNYKVNMSKNREMIQTPWMVRGIKTKVKYNE